MSIASELNNLESNIGDAYDAVNDMSGIIPQHKNMANLDQAIRTIPQSQGATYTAGNGIDIDSNNEISVDTSVVATQTDLAVKQNVLTAGFGINIGFNDVISAVPNNINSTDWNALWNGGGEFTDFSLSMTDYESYDAEFYVSPDYNSSYVYDVGDYRLYIDGTYSGGHADVTIAPIPSGATVPPPFVSVSMYDTSTTYTDYFDFVISASSSGYVITITTTGNQMVPIQYGMNYAILTIQCDSVTKTLQVRT